MTRSAFDIFHPAISLIVFVAIITNVMSAFHPLYLCISLLVALTYSTYLFGLVQTLKSLLWQLPLILIIAAINPFFSASGSTEVFHIGVRAIYGESLIYGLCMGVLLISSLLWFKCAFRIVDLDKIMVLLSKIMPSIGIMVSMCMRLVPEFLRRGRIINDTHLACTSANQNNFEDNHTKLASAFRNITVLLSWSMEDSLSAADSMKISGWGKAKRRTSYQPYRFRRRDALFAICITIIATTTLFLILGQTSSFKFYPTLSPISISYTIVPFSILLFAPLLLENVNAFFWSS